MAEQKAFQPPQESTQRHLEYGPSYRKLDQVLQQVSGTGKNFKSEGKT